MIARYGRGASTARDALATDIEGGNPPHSTNQEEHQNAQARRTVNLSEFEDEIDYACDRKHIMKSKIARTMTFQGNEDRPLMLSMWRPPNRKSSCASKASIAVARTQNQRRISNIRAGVGI